MKQSLPKISIITPSFNQGDFIEETIRSVLDQDYPMLEYLVFDGGSTDNTIQILKKYERYLVWVSRADRGQSDALNQGFRQASGEILAFINSDDRYEPGALHRVGEFMMRHPNAHWVTGKCRVIDTGGRETRKPITAYKNFWLGMRSYRVLCVLDYISQPATFWRRSVIERVGLFDENLDYSMDYDYSLRVGQYFRLWVINDYLASFRVHPASKSGRIREHFDTDLAISKRYSRSRFLHGLHRLHNSIIVGIYRLLQENRGARS